MAIMTQQLLSPKRGNLRKKGVPLGVRSKMNACVDRNLSKLKGFCTRHQRFLFACAAIGDRTFGRLYKFLTRRLRFGYPLAMSTMFLAALAIMMGLGAAACMLFGFLFPSFSWTAFGGPFAYVVLAHALVIVVMLIGLPMLGLRARTFTEQLADCLDVSPSELDDAQMAPRQSIHDAYYAMQERIAVSTSEVFFQADSDIWKQSPKSNWVDDLIRMLSFGQMSASSPRLATMLRQMHMGKTPEEKVRISDRFSSSMEDDAKVIEALISIWQSGLLGNTLSAGAADDAILAMGRALGIDIMVDAYASGVPAEDVTA